MQLLVGKAPVRYGIFFNMVIIPSRCWYDTRAIDLSDLFSLAVWWYLWTAEFGRGRRSGGFGSFYIQQGGTLLCKRDDRKTWVQLNEQRRPLCFLCLYTVSLAGDLEPRFFCFFHGLDVFLLF